MNVLDAWAAERDKLLSSPSDRFPAEDVISAKVGKTPYVRFDSNDYSVPHDRVRRVLEVRATSEKVRILDGQELVAEHSRSFDKAAQVEKPEHIAALQQQKREARQARGIDRLRHAAPSSAMLLEGAARRGHNLGSAVAALLRLMDSWGAEAVESAIIEAIAKDSPHVAAVRQVLEQRAMADAKPPPIAVELPDDARVRALHVTPHALDGYDLGGAP